MDTSSTHPRSSAVPRISVVVPAFDSERTLGGTITGALTQTHPDVEVVVVNDESRDGTLRVARGFEPLVSVVDQPNAGCAGARNGGLRVATGEFVAFCDADDILLPGALANMLAAWRAAGGGRRLLTANAYPLTQEGINPRRSTVMWSYPPPEDQRLALLEGNFASVFAFGPRALFDELGGFDASLRVIEDWDLWLRAAFAGIEIAYLKEPQALYRWTKGSMSSDSARMFAAEDELLARFAREHDGDLTDAEREYLRTRLRDGSPRRLRENADEALRRGDLDEARRLYRQASALLRHDRKLRVRAASMSAFRPVGHLWRRRVARIDEATGRSELG